MSSNGGWLNHRLKNMRDLQNKLKQKQRDEDSATSSGDVRPVNQEELNTDKAKAALTKIKSMVVGPETIDEIMRILEITREYRKQLLFLDKELNLKQEFPYFFTHPDLVRLI